MAALSSSICAPLVARASGFTGRRLRRAATNGARATMQTNWFPGSTPPAYLDGSMPCDYGFDPLGLGKEPTNLARFQEAEVLHCRWAMLGVAGIVGTEVFTGVTWTEAPTIDQTYLGVPVPFPLPAILGFEFALMAFVETKRGAETDPVKRIYPGGPFDPFGFTKTKSGTEALKRNEIANGRLAMLAFLGIVGEAQANNLEGPVHALQRHLADPWHVTAASNALAVPYL